MSPKSGLKKLLIRLMRIRRDDEAGRTLAGLIFGCMLFGILVIIIGLVFVPKRLLFTAGVILGEIAAALFLINMYDTIETSLLMNEKRAKGFTFGRKTVRLIIAIAVLVITIILDVWMFAGAAIGLYTIKLSALTNPLIDKLIGRIIEEEMK